MKWHCLMCQSSQKYYLFWALAIQVSVSTRPNQTLLFLSFEKDRVQGCIKSFIETLCLLLVLITVNGLSSAPFQIWWYNFSRMLVIFMKSTAWRSCICNNFTSLTPILLDLVVGPVTNFKYCGIFFSCNLESYQELWDVFTNWTCVHLGAELCGLVDPDLYLILLRRTIHIMLSQDQETLFRKLNWKCIVCAWALYKRLNQTVWQNPQYPETYTLETLLSYHILCVYHFIVTVKQCFVCNFVHIPHFYYLLYLL